jgi:enoyl-CoA hydratase/carnithine racemase
MKCGHTQLRFEVIDDIAYLTLDGPPGNEMDTRLFDALEKWRITTLGGEHAFLGMVVQGAGRHFSSGADVPEIERLATRGDHELERLLEENVESFLAISELHVPAVAVIRGCCLGAGMELALACHARIAEKNAVFALPEVTYDLMPGCGGTVRLPKLIGKEKALSLILTGRTVLADEAHALGLVDRVVPKNQGVAAALRYIEEQRGAI